MPPTRRVRLFIVGAAAVVGVSAVAVAYDWGEAVLWVPDLVTGIALAVCAAVAWPTRPATTWLAAASALAWFAGTVLPFGLYWHRALILHLLLAFPLAWPRRSLARFTVVGAYAASVTPYVWSAPQPAIVLALGVSAVAIAGIVRSARSAPRTPLVGLWSAVAFSAAISLTSVLQLTVPDGRAATAGYLAYCAVIVAVSIALLIAMRGPDRATVSDLVVEVATDDSRADASRIAAALGDPTVRIGYWRPDREDFVDSAGIVEPTPGQAATRVDQDGRPFALITHDRALNADPVLIESAAQAVQWTAANRRLQDEVETHIGDGDLVAGSEVAQLGEDTGRIGEGADVPEHRP